MDLPDLAATRALGRRLADALRPGDVVALRGALGAGKSELARSAIRARAGAEIEVPSPTFTLVQPYDLPGLTLWHVDLYRLTDPEEALELGLEDAAAEVALLIEWPERMADLLPPERLDVTLETVGAAGEARRARLRATGPSWAGRLAALVPRG